MDDGIPSTRLTVDQHLRRAAASNIGSQAEAYHLAAAQAEALRRCAVALEKLARGTS